MQHSERRQRNKRSMMTAVHFYTIKQMVKSCHKRSALKAYKTQHISIQEQTFDVLVSRHKTNQIQNIKSMFFGNVSNHLLVIFDMAPPCVQF